MMFERQMVTRENALACLDDTIKSFRKKRQFLGIARNLSPDTNREEPTATEGIQVLDRASVDSKVLHMIEVGER